MKFAHIALLGLASVSAQGPPTEADLCPLAIKRAETTRQTAIDNGASNRVSEAIYEDAIEQELIALAKDELDCGEVELCAPALKRAENTRDQALASGASERVAEALYQDAMDDERKKQKAGTIDCGNDKNENEDCPAAYLAATSSKQRVLLAGGSIQVANKIYDDTLERSLQGAAAGQFECSLDGKFDSGNNNDKGKEFDWDQTADDFGFNDKTNYGGNEQESLQSQLDRALKKEQAMKKLKPHSDYTSLKNHYGERDTLIKCSGFGQTATCPMQDGMPLECGSIYLWKSGSLASASFDNVCLDMHTCGQNVYLVDGSMNVKCYNMMAIKTVVASIATVASVAMFF